METTDYLSGPYAPVTDERDEPARVVAGEIPADLHGSYLQNSPNPRFPPRGRYHWFDGDGMVHGVAFEGGRARYTNRYIRTAGLAADEAAGQALTAGIMEPFDPSMVGRGGPDKDTANTDLVVQGGKLRALWWLGGTPYELDRRTLATRGPDDFGGTLPCGIAAHAKVCPRTDELLFFDYSPYAAPWFRYGVASREGRVTHLAEVPLPGARMFHDIAFTERYTILFDLPLIWDAARLAQGKRRVRFDAAMPARFGVLPRHGTGAEIRWFETDPCYIYHSVNAWEDGDALVMTACRIANPVPPPPNGTSGIGYGHAPDGKPVPRLDFLWLEPYLTQWRFDLKTGAVSERRLDDLPIEFPRTPPSLLGRKSRYTYVPRIAREHTLLFEGLARYDLETGARVDWLAGEGRVCTEPAFVARAGGRGEDDGYVVTYVHDRREGTTECAVLDAANLSDGPLALVAIARRVPFGFHTTWAPPLPGDAP